MESKMKMTIKPIAGTEKIFKVSQRRVATGPSSKNKSGFAYSLIYDARATKTAYDELVASLPAQPGILIITGHHKNAYKNIEILKSNESIRSAFSRPQNMNRFKDLLKLIEDKLYVHIQIQLASVS